eukprot:scaffold36014_cov84-Isochrysis_galbana.AAC.1
MRRNGNPPPQPVRSVLVLLPGRRMRASHVHPPAAFRTDASVTRERAGLPLQPKGPLWLQSNKSFKGGVQGGEGDGAGVVGEEETGVERAGG